MLYALLAVAECLVLALGWQSDRAHERQRRLLDSNLVEFAKFGATNFAYRAGALLANHAATIHEAVDRTRATTDTARANRARDVADSLAACRCEAALVVRAVMVLAADGQVRAIAGRDQAVPPAATLTGMYERVRRSDPLPVVRSTDDGASPMVFAMTRLAAPTATTERFLLIAYDVESVRTRVFGFIYNTHPTLLPSVFGARRSNDAVIAVRVRLAGGSVLYESPSSSRWTSVASVPLGVDTTATVQASLTDAAAREIAGVADEGIRRWWVLLATLGATGVILLTALLVRRSVALTRLRGEFTAAVSHELRTPLTEIVLSAELILTGRATSAAATTSAVQVILAEARRLHTLVENVLVMARTDRRLLRVRIGTHDGAPLVEAIVASFEPIAAKRDVRVNRELDDVPDLRCDTSALSGVLLNLLDNAVRYGPEGQTVVVRLRSASSARAMLEVDDAGPGIPPVERARVMHPYVRLERDVDGNTGGSGLGLAVATALLVEMHGSLSIHTSARGGTLMRVTLPRDGDGSASTNL